MNENIKLSAPWVQFFREIEALFERDPEIKVIYKDDEVAIKLYVENHDKAEALEQLLPSEKIFGDVIVKICVIPSNDHLRTELDLLEVAFKGNPVFEYAEAVETPYGTFNYAIFKKEVIQYFNDNIGDINGKKSTLSEDIARDVFETTNVHYCTSTFD